MIRYLPLALAAMVIALCSNQTRADDAETFYKGRNLTIGIPNPPGGGYDVYVRTLARYLGKYIPGGPNIITSNVPAGGGLALANQLFVTSPKDGTYIAMLRGTTLEEELYGNPQVQFKSTQYNWLANMNVDADTCIVAAGSGIENLKDFYKREIIVGASGVGAQSYSLPIAYQRILGMKIKVITGFDATGDRLLAMERGELNASCGISVSTYNSQVAPVAKEGKVKLVAQASMRSDPRMKDTPNILDEAKTPEAREFLEMLFLPVQLGRPLAAPPGTPPAIVAILRRAIEQTMKDPEFLAEAARLKVDVQAMTGDETQGVVERMAHGKPETRARLKELLK